MGRRFRGLPEECSSAGRASVSKTEGRGFESLHSCHYIYRRAGVLSGVRRRRKVRQAFMAKDQGAIQTTLRPRSQTRGAPVAAEPPKKPFNPVKFFREVRAEARKVTWTSWKETWITSVMVGIMVIFTAIFFFAVDWFLGMGIGALLKLANAE